MSATTPSQDYWINPRIKIAALWASTMFIFANVDLFSMYRADVRADIEAGKIFAFTIGQSFLARRDHPHPGAYIVGCLTEAALLAGVVYFAWTWPRATNAVTAPADQVQAGTGVHS